MNKQINQWHLLPFILIISLPLLIDGFGRNGSRYFIAYLFSIIIALSIRSVFNIKPFHFVLLSLPVLFIAINYDVLVIEYKSYINITTWNTLFNTNRDEAVDFVIGANKYTKLLVVIQLLTYLFFIKYTWGKTIKKITKKKRYILLALLLFFSIDFGVKGATRIAFPIRAIEGFYNFVSTKIIETKYLETKRNAKLNATRSASFNESKETIIIVVGESLRRDHLEYYGYKRNTTPYMNKEDLILFTDVVSPANQTINSLKRIFTPAEMLNENDFWKTPSLIKAFKEVGFTTYWITTQPVYGRHESLVSFIGEEADYFFAEHKKLNGHDTDMLKTVKKVILEAPKKKLIFLHIMGNHAGYYKRYPIEFEHFPRVDDEEKTLVNLYDNAVLYNDYFLHQVLTNLKNISGEKSFIMFSDHGESLFDTPNYAYHGSAEPSKSEYNIPLALWFSEEFRTQHPNTIQQLISNRNKPILLSDAFHAFPGLFGIHFDKQKNQNNFFSNSYKPKKHRKVVNLNLELLEYEKLPNGKNQISTD